MIIPFLSVRGRSPVATGPVLPANTTVFLTAGPAYCFQGRANVSTPAGNGDPVGTWVDRVDGTWFVAPSDAARPTLTQIGGEWAVTGDGIDDCLVSNVSTYNFGNGPLTMVAGVNNGNQTTNRDIVGGNATNEVAIGLGSVLNRFVHVRQNIGTSTIITPGPAVGNNILSAWSSGIVSGNISMTGRINGGANGTSTPIFSTQANTLTVGKLFPGSFFGLLIGNANFVNSTALAEAETLVQGQMP